MFIGDNRQMQQWLIWHKGAETPETYLYFGTVVHLLLLWNRIGDHHSFKAGIVDA